ncbi:MAG TPA: o-succinylbenzoate--CoA ligase, partial [Kiritimatiellia bacterium]|nr:o-succinylbenzoate--CoA ligase [Kiritimatiellia bacterium]HMP97176.1 o-succinylbenzoate--CoA ligase [Kiritimatiellia bacterium]
MSMLHCMLNEAALISKTQAAIVQGDRSIVYSEWNDLATSVAERLRRGGVGPGDRVALFLAADWRAPVLISGIIRAGAIACPLSTRLPRAAVIAQVQELEARHVIAFLSGEGREGLEGITVWSPDALTQPADRAAGKVAGIPVDAPVLILFTSGSSGRPRPAVLTYGNLYYNALGSNANFRLASHDRWLLSLPLYHVSGIGIVMRSWLAGSTMAIPEPGEDVVAALARYRISHLSLVPAQLPELLADSRTPPDNFRGLLLGGSPCPQPLLSQAHDQGWPILPTYGLTEMASQVTTMPPYAPPEKRRSTCGKVLRHREVAISAEGEILVRGPCRFAGYWREGRIVSAADASGWYSTGDIGRMDEDGYLVVCGRKDRLIISGGENIQPEEVELALLEAPGVQQVWVAAVPHAGFGQRPAAFVRAAAWEPDRWREALARRMASFKVPDYFFPWPDDAPAQGLKLSRLWWDARAAELTR